MELKKFRPLQIKNSQSLGKEGKSPFSSKLNKNVGGN
jgi:hypothetical protein